MSKTYGFVAFVAGVAIGSATSWYFLKTKYERIAQEEIDSVKEVFSKRRTSSSVVDISDKKEEDDEKKSMERYSEKLKDEGYIDYSEVKDERKEVPYVISPDELGEIKEYPIISLTLYSDGVLCDDLDEPVEDVEGMVGKESLTHFGEYEDDSVFVRNDRLKADFEILLDLRKYEDVLKKMPPVIGVWHGDD